MSLIYLLFGTSGALKHVQTAHHILRSDCNINDKQFSKLNSKCEPNV